MFSSTKGFKLGFELNQKLVYQNEVEDHATGQSRWLTFLSHAPLYHKVEGIYFLLREKYVCLTSVVSVLHLGPLRS